MSALPVPAPVRAQVPYWPKGNKNFGPKFVRYAMPWVENFYHTRGRYPNNEELMDRFGVSLEQVRTMNLHKFWRDSLERRGIPPPGLDIDFLSPKQVAAISLLTNFHIVEPLEQKMASLGVTEEELNGWYRNPAFKNALQARADVVLGNVNTDATVELARAIKKGDFRAIKFYFEITGQAQSQEAVNVKKAMQILIEAVQKHVKDEATLNAIGREVNAMREIQGL